VEQACANAAALQLALSQAEVERVGAAFSGLSRQLRLLHRARSLPGVGRAERLLSKVARRLR
jgi:hypothetical protein